MTHFRSEQEKRSLLQLVKKNKNSALTRHRKEKTLSYRKGFVVQKQKNGKYWAFPVFSLCTVGVIVLIITSILLLMLLFYVQQMQYFSLKNIEVQGIKRLSSQDIITLAEIMPQQNIFTLHIGDIYAKLKSSPWIEQLSVRRILPNTLHIDIKENTAVFWIQKDTSLYYADAFGFPIAPVEQKFFVSLPVLSIEKNGEDFILALPVIAEMLHKDIYPLDTKSVSSITLLANGRVVLHIGALSLKVTLALSNLQENVAKLHAIVNDIVKQGQLKEIRAITVDGSGLVERQ